MSAAEAKRRCPQAITIPPDHQAYSEKSREVWDLVREEIDILQQASIDEAYADLSAIERPLPFLRALIARVKEQTGHPDLGRHRAQPARRQDRLRPRQARRLRRDRPRAVRRARRRAARRGSSRASARRPRSAWPRWATRRSARCRTRPSRSCRSASASATATTCTAARTCTTARRSRPSGSAKSRSVETTFDVDIADHAELESVLRGQANKLAGQLRRAEERGRTIGIKVRLDDWTTVTRARSIDRHVDDEATIIEVALELFRDYAPPRPVRLLGVRVASFEGEEPPARTEPSPRGVLPGQLVLPLAAELLR